MSSYHAFRAFEEREAAGGDDRAVTNCSLYRECTCFVGCNSEGGSEGGWLGTRRGGTIRMFESAYVFRVVKLGEAGEEEEEEEEDEEEEEEEITARSSTRGGTFSLSQQGGRFGPWVVGWEEGL